MEHLAKVHRFFGDPKFTVPCLMLSWRETLLSTSCGPSHGPGGCRAAGHHVGLLQVATAGGEQALGGLAWALEGCSCARAELHGG